MRSAMRVFAAMVAIGRRTCEPVDRAPLRRVELLGGQLVRDETAGAIGDALVRRSHEDPGDVEMIRNGAGAVSAEELARARHHGVGREEVDDHVREDLQVLLAVGEVLQIPAHQQVRGPGDELLGLLGREHVRREGLRARRPKPPRRGATSFFTASTNVEVRQLSLARALEQRGRNDQAVDLVRPLEDPVDARVAVVTLDG